MKPKKKISFYPLLVIACFALVFVISCKKDQIQKSEIVFNPNLTYNTISDIDGNVYKTINIGTQTWMAENLKTTKYRNGDLIGTTSFFADLSTEGTPKYQWICGGYDNNNNLTYGRLYTWFALTDSRGICPNGWHVPTDSDWTTLITYLGGENRAGDKLKETGTIHWIGQNSNATNESGFSALPGGNRSNFISNAIGSYGGWWSSSDAMDANTAYVRYILKDSSIVFRDFYAKDYGFSVRCIKD